MNKTYITTNDPTTYKIGRFYWTILMLENQIQVVERIITKDNKESLLSNPINLFNSKQKAELIKKKLLTFI